MGLISDNLRPVTIRDWRTHPDNPHAPIHLRRVCGVCVHLERAADAPIRARGECAKFGLDLSGQQSAKACQFWTRRMQK